MEAAIRPWAGNAIAGAKRGACVSTFFATGVPGACRAVLRCRSRPCRTHQPAPLRLPAHRTPPPQRPRHGVVVDEVIHGPGRVRSVAGTNTSAPKAMSSQNCTYSGSAGMSPNAGSTQTTSQETPRLPIHAAR